MPLSFHFIYWVLKKVWTLGSSAVVDKLNVMLRRQIDFLEIMIAYQWPRKHIQWLIDVKYPCYRVFHTYKYASTFLVLVFVYFKPLNDWIKTYFHFGSLRQKGWDELALTLDECLAFWSTTVVRKYKKNPKIVVFQS